MQRGASSVSLAVKDLEASRAFYEKSGFRAFAGNASQNCLILKNGESDSIAMEPDIDSREFMGTFDTLIMCRKTYEGTRHLGDAGGALQRWCRGRT
jgi:catechol 2,3-dioxygenase-like lactoylglutathione lyase family enzyme